MGHATRAPHIAAAVTGVTPAASALPGTSAAPGTGAAPGTSASPTDVPIRPAYAMHATHAALASTSSRPTPRAASVPAHRRETW